MSLTLLQGYSSAEDDAADDEDATFTSDSDSDREDAGGRAPLTSYKPIIVQPESSSSGSGLPSALEAFSEVSGPPEFLNNCIEEREPVVVHRGRRRSRDKKDLPAGAVMEAKPQLVGIRERVRNDIDCNTPSTSSTQSQKGSSGITVGAKRVSTAGNPGLEDASELLRMCLQCGIPKTYSAANGMVCPQCGDRPPPDDQGKKKGSMIKDKEKVKRMKGQSSHATWKSETEMQLRQQFD
ncbi:hypothetical protein Droror1_Dr00007069 [Drosera rotundifolia]